MLKNVSHAGKIHKKDAIVDVKPKEVDFLVMGDFATDDILENAKPAQQQQQQRQQQPPPVPPAPPATQQQ